VARWSVACRIIRAGSGTLRDTAFVVRALILIGAPGAGKSSVLDALSTLLELDGVEHGAIESEELSRGWPLLVGAQWTGQLEPLRESWRPDRLRGLGDDNQGQEVSGRGS
jgi:hypothetical protein